MTVLPPPSEFLDLSGRVVVVTGAAGGIGAGIARRLSAAGASVLAHTRTTSLEPLLGSLTGPAASVAVDLTAAEGPARVLEAAQDSFGRLDALINNAALQTLATLPELTDDEWSRMLETNLGAAHRLTRAVAQHLIDRRAPGSIVHIASIEGLQPAPAHGHYATSKAGLIMHSRAAALEYGPHGIRVNSVSPGLVHREGLEQQWPEGVRRWRSAAPLGRLGTPEDVGDACVFLVSELSRWITGANLVVDGGVLARPTW